MSKQLQINHSLSLKLHKCDTKVVASSLQNGVRTGPLFLNKGQNVHIPILGCIASLILNSLPNIGSVHVGNPNIYLSTSIKTRTLSKENTGMIQGVLCLRSFLRLGKNNRVSRKPCKRRSVIKYVLNGQMRVPK